MCESLGKRVSRKVKRDGFIEEEEFEQILIEEYGLTAEDLEDDVAPHGSAGSFHVDRADILLPDGQSVTLCVDRNSDFNVLLYLENQLDAHTVSELWKNKENQKAIGALIRYPGGWHEWLMVASLPLLKAMEIPLAWIWEFRTETAECQFYYQEGDRYYPGIHGGEGSTRMHNDLFRCYSSVYFEFYQGQCRAGADAAGRIRSNLLKFAGEHFDEEIMIPDALSSLIDRLGSYDR